MILIGQYDSPFVRRVGIALTLAVTAMPWPLIPIGAAVVIGGWLWTRPEA